jgi:hypothetical protein
MSKHDRLDRGPDLGNEILKFVSHEIKHAARRSYRRRRRRRGGFRKFMVKLFKAWLLMTLSSVVIITTMISQGWLFGPKGIEGLIIAPMVLFASWMVVVYFMWFHKPSPTAMPVPGVKPNSSVAQLPAQTDSWLESQRDLLPGLAQAKLDDISLQLERITPQLQALEAQSPAASEARRLLGEELPELVRSYHKVPRALRSQPLHGGSTPERQLIEGLETIDEQLKRMHEDLAASDLKALATHQRYLELKYGGGDDDDQ